MAGKVRLQNQGKRTIHIGPQQKIGPNTIAIVSNEVAEKHIRLYPKELVNLDKITPESPEDKVQDFTGGAEEEAGEDEKPAAGGKRGNKKAAAAAKGGADDDDALAAALKAE